MAKIFKPKGSDKYVLFYTDHTGRRRKKTLEADFKKSERLKAAILEKSRLRKDGLVDPDDEMFAEADLKPLVEHLEDWRNDLVKRRKSPAHADQSVERVRRLVAVIRGAKPGEIDGKTMTRAQLRKAREHIKRLVGQVRLSVLTGDSVQSAIAELRDAGRSLQT